MQQLVQEKKDNDKKDEEYKHEKEYKVRLLCSNSLFLQSPSSAAGHAWLCDLRSGCVSIVSAWLCPARANEQRQHGFADHV